MTVVENRPFVFTVMVGSAAIGLIGGGPEPADRVVSAFLLMGMAFFTFISLIVTGGRDV